MWIFGRKANQQSTTPDVPPELKPYFSSGSFATRVRRVFSGVTPLVILLVIIAVLVGGVIWLHGRSTTNQKVTPDTSQSQTTTNQGSSQTGGQTPDTSNTQPSSPAATQTDTSSQSIPNTGPGSVAVILAVGASLLGTIVYHAYQIRTLRR